MAPSQPRSTDFSFPPSLAKFNVPYEEFLTIFNSTQSTPLDGVATGAIVFKTRLDDPQPRILLVQRSSTDSMPNRWETPGGAVDPGETILSGAAREVMEESGMVVREILGLMEYDEEGGVDGGYVFRTRTKRRILKFTFVVEVRDPSALRLDPSEHQDYVWATEEACRKKRAIRTEETGLGKEAALDLEFTTLAQETVIMKAFSVLQNKKTP